MKIFKDISMLILYSILTVCRSLIAMSITLVLILGVVIYEFYQSIVCLLSDTVDDEDDY